MADADDFLEFSSMAGFSYDDDDYEGEGGYDEEDDYDDFDEDEAESYDDVFGEDDDPYDEPFDDQEIEDGYDNRKRSFDGDDLYNDDEEIEEDSDLDDLM